VFIVLISHLSKRLLHIILPSVDSTVLPYFSILYLKGMIFEKKLLNIKYVLILCTEFFWNVSHFKMN